MNNLQVAAIERGLREVIPFTYTPKVHKGKVAPSALNQLAGVRMTGNGITLTLSATDMARAHSVTIPVPGLVCDGVIAAPKNLAEWLKLMGKEVDMVSWSDGAGDGGARLVTKAGRIKAQWAVKPADGWPADKLAAEEGAPGGPILAEEVAKIAAGAVAVTVAVANGFVVVAVNENMAAAVTYEGNVPDKASRTLVVTGKDLRRALKGLKGEVIVRILETSGAGKVLDVGGRQVAEDLSGQETGWARILEAIRGLGSLTIAAPILRAALAGAEVVSFRKATGKGGRGKVEMSVDGGEPVLIAAAVERDIALAVDVDAAGLCANLKGMSDMVKITFGMGSGGTEWMAIEEVK